jgi:cell division septation protein DedD
MGLFAIIWLVGCTAQTAQAPLQPTPEPTRTTDRPTPAASAAPPAPTVTTTPEAAALPVIYFMDAFG